MVTRRQKLRLNEAGQGTVEYVLVLMITVIVILTVMMQFSGAFRAYANGFFGEYVACLLETGELPGGPLCANEWKDFNLADGKAGSVGDGGGGSGSGSGSGNGSGGSGSDGSKSSSKTGDGDSGKSKSDSSGSNSASNSKPSGETLGSPGDGNSGGGFGSRSKGRQRSTSVAGTAKGSDAGAGREPLTALANTGRSNSNGDNSSGRKQSLSRDYGYFGQKEDEDREASRPAVKEVAKDTSGRLRPKKVAEGPQRAPASKSMGDDDGFSFGSFIRIILIAGILIAIFILFGGQLLAISKSGEK